MKVSFPNPVEVEVKPADLAKAKEAMLFALYPMSNEQRLTVLDGMLALLLLRREEIKAPGTFAALTGFESFEKL